MDNVTRKLITSEANVDIIRSAAVKQGMRPLRISGAQKVAEGLTSLEEIYSIISPNDE